MTILICIPNCSKCYLISLIAFFFLHIAHAQCLLKPTSLNQRLTEASIVVEAKVLRQHCFWGAQIDMIYTAHEIEVYRIFKGQISSSKMEIITPGGQINEQMMVINPSMQLKTGQTGVFLLRPYQGKLIDNTQKTIWLGVAEQASLLSYDPRLEKAKDAFGEEFSSRSQLYQKLEDLTGYPSRIIRSLPLVNISRFATPTISSISPTTVTAGTETLLTINGSNFGTTMDTVYFDYASDGAGGAYFNSSDYHIQSWVDNKITIWVPSGAGTGKIYVKNSSNETSSLSSQTLTVSYNVNNVNDSLRTYFIDDACDSNGGYKFSYSTSTSNSGVDFTTESSGAAKAAFERAVSSWQTGVGFAIYAGEDCGNTTIQVPAADGTNIIAFDNSAYDLDVEASSSTLGITKNYYSKCGASEWEVVDFDLVFRRDGDPNGFGGSVTWEFGTALPSGGESDFESVVLHELGHANQLGHIISSGAVMHYSITTGTYNRSLGTEDINGGNDVETASLAYSPPVIACGADFNCSRAYAVYSVGNECATLPVELLAFTGYPEKAGILLEWETASEINNDFFTLERSGDGQHFKSIATLPGNGTTASSRDYHYFDDNPLTGLNYYRLSQTDYNGKTEQAGDIISFHIKGKQAASLQPNLVYENLHLTYEAEKAGRLELSIFGIDGRLYQKTSLPINNLMSKFTLPVLDLPRGIYILKTFQQNHTILLQFVKM